MMLASDKAVDFAISLAGMTVSGKELLLRQNRDALAGMGLSSDLVDIYCKHLSDGMDAVIVGKDPEPVNDTKLPAALNDNLNKAFHQFSTPYMRSFIRLSAKDNLAKTTVPLLALNGTKDTQVDYVNNLAAVKSLSPNKPFTVKSYESLNHFFQHAETGSVDEYCKIEETISLEVLSDIIVWIKSLE